MKKHKMDKYAVAFVMFVVCTTLVSVMLMQFKTVEETDITEIENMREAELRKTLSEWKSKYSETSLQLEETNQKIAEYSEKIEKKEAASELIDKELLQSNLYVGKTDVVGEGVIVTLNNNDDYDISSWDLLYLVNELKYAGAEAISINDIRIINTTEIAELGGFSFISVGQRRLEAPYVVKAIGDQDYLSSVLKLKGSGFVDIYINSGKDVKIETNKKISILKYNGEMNYRNLKIEEEKE